MLCGIANCYPLKEYLSDISNEVVTINFRDHHDYSVGDINKVRKEFDTIYAKNKIIVTTEKDAMRLRKPELKELISDLPVFYIPIKLDFHNGDNIIFENKILEYVES